MSTARGIYAFARTDRYGRIAAVAVVLVGLVLITTGVLTATTPATDRQYPIRPASQAEQLRWQQEHLAWVIEQYRANQP